MSGENQTDELELQITPKGVVAAALLQAVPSLNETGQLVEVTEQIMEGLYRHAVARCRGEVPLLAFLDGRWIWTAGRKED